MVAWLGESFGGSQVLRLSSSVTFWMVSLSLRLAYFHVVALAVSLHWLVFAAVHSATILSSCGIQAGTFIHGFFKIALIKVENIGVSYIVQGKDGNQLVHGPPGHGTSISVREFHYHC